jgi:hypothetical protein
MLVKAVIQFGHAKLYPRQNKDYFLVLANIIAHAMKLTRWCL